LKFIFDMF